MSRTKHHQTRGRASSRPRMSDPKPGSANVDSPGYRRGVRTRTVAQPVPKWMVRAARKARSAKRQFKRKAASAAQQRKKDKKRQ